MYKFILKCNFCKWLKTCNGTEEELSSLREVKKGCKSYFQRNLTSKAIKAEKMLGVKIPRMIKLPQKKETIFQKPLESRISLRCTLFKFSLRKPFSLNTR